MWLYKYVVCLIKKHLFIPLQSRGASYQYCLRCGKLAVATAGEGDPVAHDEVASA
jgi:hypothetical protein